MKNRMVDSTLIADAAAGGMNSIAALNMRPPEGPVNDTRIQKMLSVLKEYQAGKQNLDHRIIRNAYWWKLRHWDLIRQEKAKKENIKNDVEPASAWLFNNLVSKHASIMDNFPEPNILPREQGDEPDADVLSSVIPVILERNEFEQTYSDAQWYKLKNGCVPYGLFWDGEKENGLGDVSIVKLDLLNLFWKPGITDIQQSPYFFIASLEEHDDLKAQFPWISDSPAQTIKIVEYAHDESIDTTRMDVVIDAYYKAKELDEQGNPTGRKLLHYVKFVGGQLLYATENDPNFVNRGLYDHGLYPVVFDVLYPEDDMPTGIGLIDIMKEPQIYIDKLDQIIMKNALMAGKKRWFTRDDGTMNEEEYADWSNDFVHVTGSLDEKNIKEIDVKPLDGFIVQHKQMKIDEQKETSANRDFSQGGVTGGVTAASAIAALQEAGGKADRDITKSSYRAFTKIVYFVIELDRQFYDEPRNFRIVGDSGAINYVQHSNANLKMQTVPAAFPGAQETYRLPIFDIKVRAQRSNPFNKAAQNELAVALLGQGLFTPQNVDAALVCLEMMDFEGKQKVIQKVSQNGQAFMLVNQLMQMMAMQAGVQPGQPGQKQEVQK